MSKHCIIGCKSFEGGEIVHHPDCDFYPGSMTEKYDNLKQEIHNIHQQAKLPADIELLIKSCFTNENGLIATYAQSLALKYKIEL